jgi:hypothetical protein
VTNARTFVHLSTGLLCVLLGACDQPAPKCNVAHGQFWAKYTLVSGEGDCAMLTGEELDVQSYYAQRSANDKRPDYDKVSIAIQPFAITAALGNAAGIADPDPDDRAYGIGRFVSQTARSDGFCVANTLSSARLRLPAVPAHELDMCTSAPDAPEYDLEYEFSHVRVYYTPAAIGTQFSADLTYTVAGCVATYKVSAVYPIVPCGTSTPLEDAGPDAAADSDPAPLDPDAAVAADGGEPCPPPDPPSGPPVPDDSLCANAGINPDFAVVCDPAAMMCVLSKRSPSLK